MNEYYGVSPHSDFFMHYGIKGMKWGVRKAIEKKLANHKIKRISKEIDRHSNNNNPGNWPGAKEFRYNGYMHADRFNPKSNRAKLFNKISKEYDASMRKSNSYDGSPYSQAVWKKLNKKYKNDYLKAVLADSRLPITKQNMQLAHKIISSKDTEYTRYDRKK